MGNRVLVIDDEAAIRESLTEFLEDFDFQVTAASSAEEALDILKLKQLDAIVADLRMGGMRGDAMIPLAHRIQPHLHFLIHTGSAGYHLSDELLNLGMKDNDVLLKPMPDMMILINNLKNKLSQKSSQDSY